MVVGALLLSSPLLAMLAITYDPGTRVAASDGEDTAMLARAARYDARLLRDGGSTAVGEAADPFSGTDAPAWRSDRDYLNQLGAGDAMARIRIPSIGVDLPVRHGADAYALENGAGHLHGTSLPVGGQRTHSVITGHTGVADKALFTRLTELRKGDVFYVRVAAQTLAYKVERIRKVDPDDLRDVRIQPGRDLVTLVTCTPIFLNTYRLGVTGGSAGEANRTGGLPLDVSKVRRIWPCQGGEGHFIARLVKAGTPRTLPAPGEYTPEEQLWLAAAAEAGKKAKGSKPQKAAKPADARSARRENSRACREAVQGRSSRSREAGAGDASPAQSLAAWREFAEEYFPELAKRPAVVHGGGVLLPAAFPQTNLHVLRAGVFVGSVQKGRFVPEHHLFTAFGALCRNREELTLADSRTVEYLSGREIEAHTVADGWCCVTVDGWPLGGGKVSGGRVKNHYPKALRLL